MNTSIYQNIATRTAGDIYIGVVGPVRTGKSTFIKRFMETQVIPNIENVYRRERARDELPQSGSGRTGCCPRTARTPGRCPGGCNGRGHPPHPAKLFVIPLERIQAHCFSVYPPF